MFIWNSRLPAILATSVLFLLGSTRADQPNDDPIVIKSDSGERGGHVNFEALPSPASTNSLKKRMTIESLDNVQSAQVLIFGALRDPTESGGNSVISAFKVWEWIYFELNGYEWVVRAEDMSLHRRGLFAVDWRDVRWAAVPIPDVRYLKKGVNELVIWNNNLPEKPKNKYLVVAYDDSRKSENSFSLVKGKWSAGDLNGDRDGTPQGEWMIRLKLNPLPTEEQKRVDALGAARFREAAGQKKDFVWGFTDAVHRIFPDRPYVGPLGNEWTLDAARDERESCQLLLIPVATEMRMTAVFVGDFHPFQGGLIRNGPAGVTIPASAVAVRLVRTVLVNKQEWPDPLPQAYRIDIPLGRVQAYWLTVHVPADARPGAYRATVTVASMNTGGRDGRVVKFPLDLRVRDFAVPALSRYQMVVHGQATPAYHLVRGVPSTFLMWVCRQP